MPKSEEHGNFPPFDADSFASQLVWLAIAFVVLYVLMAKLALPRVGAIIEGRQKRIEGDLADAEKLKGQSEAALATYEKALADARARAQAIANETRERQAAQAPTAARRSKTSSTSSWPRPRRPSPRPSRRPCPMCAASPRKRRAPSSSG